MKVKDVVITIIIAATIGGIIWVIVELVKTKKQVGEIQSDLEKLLKFQIEQSQKPEKISECLAGLISYFEGKDADVTAELMRVSKRLNEGEEADASRIITKVVENKLKEKAQLEDSAWCVKFKSMDKIKLHNLIDWGRKINFFDEVEYNAALLVKEFRNEDTHQMNLETKVSYNDKMLNVHVGIKILEKFI